MKIPNELRGVGLVDLEKQESYYSLFFEILIKLFPKMNLGSTAAKFHNKYETLQSSSVSIIHQSDLEDEEAKKKTNNFNQTIRRFILQRRKVFLLSGVFLLSIIGLGFLVIKEKNEEVKKLSHNISQNKREKKEISIRSDLIIPAESTFLNRPEIIVKINEAFKKQEGIKTVALVGIGGSGKTTLARQYVRQQKAGIIWEFNAETKESLKTGFESLAQALSKTEEDQRIFREIQDIKNSIEKEEKIIQFAKKQLKAHLNWFLIYDNVEKFADIQKYFPHDSNVWGQGKVILTTRNSNIQNNNYVSNIIYIGELKRPQSLNFFAKIMSNGDVSQFTPRQKEEAEKFLNEIPPFPLDISIAAYYLKATGVPHERYLKYAKEHNNEFEKMNENILKDTCAYTKTRYNIITLSLKRLIETHKDFGDLLLFMSLLHSQNIPRALLEAYKGEIIVDNFIFNLKKYSLIMDESLPSLPSPTLSIHRSTQEICLAYLIKTLGPEKTKELVEEISEFFESHINAVVKDEDLIKMKLLISHCEAFLNHKQLLTLSTEGIIKGELGIIHYYYGDNMRAKSLFEESLLILNKNHDKNPTRIAMFMGYLGNVFRDLGDYNKGKTFLEKSLFIYDKHYPRDYFKHAYCLVYLGIIERIMGNYDEAKNLFEKGASIYKKHFPENENYPAWVYGQIGIVDRDLGNYEKSKEIFEKSLASFKTHRSPNHFDIAWALEHLGVVYTKLGNYEKAKDALEESLKIYASYFPERIGSSWLLANFEPLDTSESRKKVKRLFDQVIKNNKYHFHDNYIYVAWPLRQLGNLYVKIGNYEKAKILLEQTLVIYEKNYGSNHLQVAQTLNDFGKAYFLADNLKTSEDFIEKALRIFQHYKHPEAYACLENLSDLFIKKSNLAESKGDTKSSQDFKTQAVAYLKQALEITKVRFPKYSPHIKRIEYKLIGLERG